MLKMKKITNAPGWLGLTSDRSAFVYLPDRAEIVSQIFRLSIAGVGGYTIAKLLNARGIPAFGSSKRWDQSTVHNMLSSRATIGEYCKKAKVGGKEVAIGLPIPDYYPAVIDKEIFEKAQVARRESLSKRRGRKGKLITNLFGDIPKCIYCGSNIKLHNAPNKSLVCKRVWDGGSCFRYRWSYDDFERQFLRLLYNNDKNGHYKEYIDLLLSDAQHGNDDLIHEVRFALTLLIRSGVIKLTIAFGGAAPPAKSMHGVIIRDEQSRYFEAELSDGTLHVGRPSIAPKPKLVRTIKPEALCKRLGLSPRQAELAALLAAGETLRATAEELGLTLSTARWHLKEIFRRTNLRSQVELVKLIQTTE
jgi:DNA-binding CsgD family transcriptional regulator